MSNGELVMAAVGDFMISRRPTAEEIAVTRSLFEGADVVVANIDTVLSNEGTPTPKWANLRGPRETAIDLREMGIDVAVMANNHVMDFRAPGMLDARQALADAGILPVGAGKDLAEATRPVFVKKNGVKVAILAVACTLPVESAAAADWPGIAPVHVRYAFEVEESLCTEQPGSVPKIRSWIVPNDLNRVEADVRAAASAADVVVAVVHWGVPRPWRAPFHPVIQDYQCELSRALVDAGAAAVIGNHPHELHGVDFCNGAPIAYCVGNFWIDTLPMFDWMGRESVVLRISLTKHGVSAVAIDPLMLSTHGLPEIDFSGRTIDVMNTQSLSFGVTVDGNHQLVAAGSPRQP